MLVAGSAAFEYDTDVHTQYMASSDLGGTIGALDLAISTVMNDYREKKLWMDFGISTEDQGRVLNEGLLPQKEGFGRITNIYTVWKSDAAANREGYWTRRTIRSHVISLQEVA